MTYRSRHISHYVVAKCYSSSVGAVMIEHCGSTCTLSNISSVLLRTYARKLERCSFKKERKKKHIRGNLQRRVDSK